MGKRLLSILGILVFLVILGAVSGNAESAGYCQHCRQEVTWQPLTKAAQGDISMFRKLPKPSPE